MTVGKKNTHARARRSDEIELAGASISEYRGVRSLHLGTPWIQGSMRINQPLKLELEYIRRMMACLLLLPEAADGEWPNPGPGPMHAVQLGLGAASITKFCHRALGWHSTAVEINATVITACRQFFYLDPDDERLQVLQADAADYVADTSHHGSADALFVDLYDHEAASPVLDDLAFYRLCKAVLRPHGVMSVNLFGRQASFARSMQHLADAFEPEQVAFVSPTSEGNAVALAWRSGGLPERDILLARAQRLEACFGLKFGLKATAWVKYMRYFEAQPAASG